MRRLIVEISSGHLSKLDPEWPIQKIKSMEILHFLRFDHQEFAAIARVEFNKQNVRIEDVFPDDLVETQLLEHEKENGVYTYFIKTRLSQAIHGEPGLTVFTVSGYFFLPFEVKDGKVKTTFLGTAKQ